MRHEDKRRFKDEIFAQFARIGKALSSGCRLELLDLLAQGERGVEDLAIETTQSVANISQHLQILRQVQLVESRRDGNYIRYRLADRNVLHLWLALRDLGQERLAEIDRLVQTYLNDRNALEAITCTELRRRIKYGGAVVLDVRPPLEFAAGHIAGARSIPVAELRTRLGEVPKRRVIVAYCRGPYCVFADQAVGILRRAGYKAIRLDGGFPEWQMKGMPVERNAVEM
ncbi:MAG TPA: metalloregulator ArsR/SmtB family transcription factor [Bryobacteraceae bacterium]|jgi:rhodanese-related sulfurtransferase